MVSHESMKKFMTDHKQKVELLQWAVISGISSLVYSEFISKLKQKVKPVRRILLPTIRSVQELLNPNNPFMEQLSNELINRIYGNQLFQQFKEAPELIIFNQDNLDTLKIVYELYMSQNIFKRIPETIAKKFDLYNDKQQLFVEDRSIDLFNRQSISEDQIKFIVDQIVLQLLLLLPTMKKEIEFPESNNKIHLTETEILTIGNDSAICPIHFNDAVIQNPSVDKLLMFVTSTTISRIDVGENILKKNDEVVKYLIGTYAFNQTCITKLIGIEYNKKGE